jgi:hypothetical protein
MAIRRARVRTAFARAARRAWSLLLLVPLVFAVVEGSRFVAGGPPSALGFWQLLGLSILSPVLWLGWAAGVAAHRAVSRRDALGATDELLGDGDRLLTAEELLERPVHSAFARAALADARPFAVQAKSAALAFPFEPLGFAGREKALVGAAVLLIALAATFAELGSPIVVRHQDELASVPDLARLDPIRGGAEDDVSPPAPAVSRPEEASREPVSNAEAAGLESRASEGELPQETKRTEGKTGAGRSSQTESTSGASEARGAPTNQSQTSRAGEKKPPKPGKEPERKPGTKPTEPKKADEQDSGSTAGRGSSRGSNKNPVATDWQSKDQVTAPDDQEIDADEEIDDEDEEQESRGGVQPHLRDRRPPVSRDLQIGFGNRPSPDANGRGGPSEPKKSRGTASLVLGVPIPDRVKGQPNPGRTKITQERIEPRPEDAGEITASPREPRELPVGVHRRGALAPWMRELVRGYFLDRRTKSTEPTTDDETSS